MVSSTTETPVRIELDVITRMVAPHPGDPPSAPLLMEF